MAQYENKGDRQNILLADKLPEDMTGTQDTQRICGKCAWFSFLKLESICRRTGKEVAYFANRECFTTEKDTTMEENNNAQPVAETGTQICKECGRTLPLEDLQRRRNGNVDNVCKACRAEKARIGIARKKAAKVEFPEKIVKAVNAPSQVINELLEDAVKTEGEEIAELSRYLRDFKIAGLALWGKMPGKEEDIDNMIEAEWTVPFCQEIFAAAADLKRDGKNVVPILVERRLGNVGLEFVDDLGETFYLFAKECDTEEQMPAEWSEEDEKMLVGIIERGSAQIPPYEPALREDQMEWLMNRLKYLRSRPKSSDNLKPSEEQPARVPDISDATLLDELRRRGYKGRISKCEEVEI